MVCRDIVSKSVSSALREEDISLNPKIATVITRQSPPIVDDTALSAKPPKKTVDATQLILSSFGSLSKSLPPQATDVHYVDEEMLLTFDIPPHMLDTGQKTDKDANEEEEHEVSLMDARHEDKKEEPVVVTPPVPFNPRIFKRDEIERLKGEHIVHPYGDLFTEKYRPKFWHEFVGNPRAVRQVRDWYSRYISQVPNMKMALMIVGPTGTGKRSLVKCLAQEHGARLAEFGINTDIRDIRPRHKQKAIGIAPSIIRDGVIPAMTQSLRIGEKRRIVFIDQADLFNTKSHYDALYVRPRDSKASHDLSARWLGLLHPKKVNTKEDDTIVIAASTGEKIRSTKKRVTGKGGSATYRAVWPHPLVLTVSDQFAKNIKSLKPFCEIVYLDSVMTTDVLIRLEQICAAENVVPTSLEVAPSVKDPKASKFIGCKDLTRLQEGMQREGIGFGRNNESLIRSWKDHRIGSVVSDARVSRSKPNVLHLIADSCRGDVRRAVTVLGASFRGIVATRNRKIQQDRSLLATRAFERDFLKQQEVEGAVFGLLNHDDNMSYADKNCRKMLSTDMGFYELTKLAVDGNAFTSHLVHVNLPPVLENGCASLQQRADLYSDITSSWSDADLFAEAGAWKDEQLAEFRDILFTVKPCLQLRRQDRQSKLQYVRYDTFTKAKGDTSRGLLTRDGEPFDLRKNKTSVSVICNTLRIPSVDVHYLASFWDGMFDHWTDRMFLTQRFEPLSGPPEGWVLEDDEPEKKKQKSTDVNNNLKEPEGTNDEQKEDKETPENVVGFIDGESMLVLFYRQRLERGYDALQLQANKNAKRKRVSLDDDLEIYKEFVDLDLYKQVWAERFVANGYTVSILKNLVWLSSIHKERRKTCFGPEHRDTRIGGKMGEKQQVRQR